MLTQRCRRTVAHRFEDLPHTTRHPLFWADHQAVHACSVPGSSYVTASAHLSSLTRCGAVRASASAYACCRSLHIRHQHPRLGGMMTSLLLMVSRSNTYAAGMHMPRTLSAAHKHDHTSVRHACAAVKHGSKMVNGGGEYRVYQNFWYGFAKALLILVCSASTILLLLYDGRFHAQRFYAVNCLATKEANATVIKGDITLNMMLIEMPVARAADFYQHVQVQVMPLVPDMLSRMPIGLKHDPPLPSELNHASLQCTRSHNASDAACCCCNKADTTVTCAYVSTQLSHVVACMLCSVQGSISITLLCIE